VVALAECVLFLEMQDRRCVCYSQPMDILDALVLSTSTLSLGAISLEIYHSINLVNRCGCWLKLLSLACLYQTCYGVLPMNSFPLATAFRCSVPRRKSNIVPMTRSFLLTHPTWKGSLAVLVSRRVSWLDSLPAERELYSPCMLQEWFRARSGIEDILLNKTIDHQ
jgi:hypothetical protein